MKAACLMLALVATTAAKKGGKTFVDPNILNPDPTAPVTKDDEYSDGMIQGDILPTVRSTGDDRNALSDLSKYWSFGMVPYTIDHELMSSDMIAKINVAIADFHEFTCIRFVPRKDEKQYLRIVRHRPGCFSNLGRQEWSNVLNLGGKGCFSKGIIIHEMLHTIGIGHEQARNDRDDYIKVHWDNIKEGKDEQFAKLGEGNERTYGFPYDFSSVMHYGDRGFAKDQSKPTITTKDPSKQQLIGQRQGFSKQDVEEVNKMYRCKTGCYDNWGANTCKYRIGRAGDSACSDGTTIALMCQKTCLKCL